MKEHIGPALTSSLYDAPIVRIFLPHAFHEYKSFLFDLLPWNKANIRIFWWSISVAVDGKTLSRCCKTITVPFTALLNFFMQQMSTEVIKESIARVKVSKLLQAEDNIVGQSVLIQG